MNLEAQDLHYKEDDQGRRLYYRFTPAALISNFVPLVVLLHDKGESHPLHFEHKMWNVLTPLDTFGSQNKGSCWLGEEGDFFLIKLMQELVDSLALEHDCEDHIYFYGKGMGGYGAILHAVLNQANAVYAHQPYINLREEQKQFYDVLFSRSESIEYDLVNLLHTSKQLPIFFLSDPSLQQSDSNCVTHHEALQAFIRYCEDKGLKYRIDESFKESNDEEASLKEVLTMLEKISSQI